eukprot:jgi/Mesen1/813/ME000110S_11075
MALSSATHRIAFLAISTLTFIFLIAQLGVTSYVVDELLSGNLKEVARTNAATQQLIIFSTIGNIIGAVAWVLTVVHFFARDQPTLVGACTVTLQSLGFYLLALGLGSKQTSLGGVGHNERTMFALVVVLAFLQALASIVGWLGFSWTLARRQSAAHMHQGTPATAPGTGAYVDNKV